MKASKMGLSLMDAAGVPAMAPTAPQTAPLAAEKTPWGNLLLGMVLDGIAGAQGREGPYAVMQQQRQQNERKLADWGRIRQAERADYEWQKGVDQRYAKPPSPYRFQDNAGNVWERGPDGQNVRIFTDEAPKQMVHDGMLLTIPNPYSTRPAVPPTIDDNLWNTGKPVGGQAPAPGGFRR